ncbi:carbon-nitrogen hydrolase [Roridomyces roridus]|uniref:Carbon-nitrogen hydrolase n=1 Tax=Roridomyces roridus TaxID=1738132 RepID=A0AAD7BMI0_9AGAR|nr:carbon-nitrogen hydrolase [Roridomyces roridus]
MKVAAIQAEPAWWDLKAGVAKTIALIKEAAANGAQLVGFPESFIPGYPMRIWSQPFNPQFLLEFKQNCLDVKSGEFQEILDAVKEAGIWVVLGFCEVDGGSMYAAQVIISNEGSVVLHRRKIKATGNERTVWGDAPGDSLQSAVVGPDGVTIGALNCWEHLQPLLRFHHYSLGVQIHVASWPFCDSTASPGTPTTLSSDAQIVQCRMAALEGQMFVISSTQMISSKNAELCGVKGTPFEMPLGGGFAAIYGPDSVQLTAPTKPDEEIIVYADINLDDIKVAKLLADSVGHYSRPGLLSLHVNSQPKPLVSYEGRKEYALLNRKHGAQ